VEKNNPCVYGAGRKAAAAKTSSNMNEDMNGKVEPYNWYYSSDHRQLCQIVDIQRLWGETICRVWLPEQDTVIRLSVSRLKAIEEVDLTTPDSVAYVAAAARVMDA
jgi:hypothetical protein